MTSVGTGCGSTSARSVAKRASIAAAASTPHSEDASSSCEASLMVWASASKAHCSTHSGHSCDSSVAQSALKASSGSAATLRRNAARADSRCWGAGSGAPAERLRHCRIRGAAASDEQGIVVTTHVLRAVCCCGCCPTIPEPHLRQSGTVKCRRGQRGEKIPSIFERKTTAIVETLRHVRCVVAHANDGA